MDPELKAALDKAFLAEGWRRRGVCWALEPFCTRPFDPSYYIYDKDADNYFEGLKLEDLPRFLADDKGGEEAFGYDWHSGIKQALCRLLKGG